MRYDMEVMMKRSKKSLFTLLILLGLLFLFAFLLKWAETSGTPAEGGGITTWREALWYLVVTLTTVGYGDLVPHTAVGKAIGALFLVGSIGLFSWLVGLAISLLSGNLLPSIHLRLMRNRRWYLFSEDDPRSRLLADRLAEEDSDAAIIFCRSDLPPENRSWRAGKHPVLSVRMDYDECLLQRPGKRDGVSLFLLGEDGWDNYLRAKKAAASGCRVYCRTNAHPDNVPLNMTLFTDCDAVGRIFWQEHPLEPWERELVLIGGSRYGEALLEKGIMNNVFSPDQEISYHVFGDFSHFKDIHGRLASVMKVDSAGNGRDSIIFHKEAWRQCADLLERADRIILCADTDEEELDLYWTLRTYYPVRGKVYVRLSRNVEEAGMIIFGDDEGLYQPENIMHKTLISLGIRVNELYRAKYGGSSWEELSEFHRQSSIASADHLSVKASILLKETIRGMLSQEDARRAFAVYQETADEKHDLYRWVEHERWNRFHTMYNWQYADQRDNTMRRHTLLIPYEDLSLKEQEKDDDAWLLLGEFAKQ